MASETNDTRATDTLHFRVGTAHAPGAIAVIDLFGDVDRAFAALDLKRVAIGRPALRDLGGVDDGIVVRWSEEHAQLLPHAGPQVIRSLAMRLERIGAVQERDPSPSVAFPEAAGPLEARMLDALARAESPAAIDILLAQPERWRAAVDVPIDLAEQRAMSQALDRLVTPALVVAIGPPNIGKSTLTNALAREAVSVVADQPGTTRDHVGVSLGLPSPAGAVVIHWIDAPGFRTAEAPDPIEAEAIRLARGVAARADVLISCGDAEHGFLDLVAAGIVPRGAVLRVGLRADRGSTPQCDLETAAATGRGVQELATLLRRTLVPDAALSWNGPWRFHPSLGEASHAG